MNKLYITWLEVDQMVNILADKIEKDKLDVDSVYGIPRGGLILAVMLSHKLNLTLTDIPTSRTLICDDISDTGDTIIKFKERIRVGKLVCLYKSLWTKVNPDYYFGMKFDKDTWLIFPWENKKTEEGYSSGDNRKEGV